MLKTQQQISDFLVFGMNESLVEVTAKFQIAFPYRS